MVLTSNTVRARLIRPALMAIDLWTPAAENLVLVTGANESSYVYTHQRGGPALGYWEMEPATHDSLWANFLAYKPQLSAAVKTLLPTGVPTDDQLMTNPQYAAAMCRVKYFDAKMAIPAENDRDGMWAIYKQVYNTPQGAATQDRFNECWITWIA